jgi:hypothetical protein
MALTKTGNKTFLPCRIDEVHRRDMMDSDITDCTIRDAQEYNKMLETAFEAFAMSVKIKFPRNLPEDMKLCLDFCQQHSLQPLLPALNTLEPAYEGHSAYEMVPPDLMHTFGGILEAWISMVVTIIAIVRRDYPGYNNNIAFLEELLANFPYKQAMPFNCKHFNRGLTMYIPGLDSKLEDKTTGYGVLKLIDYKDVPHLMLQIIICK